ncbi:hypothetical protein CLF_111773 [Clonorchis sinensis]|uniref:Uncharacterized protein n=1 Tax=Clonorchis sinensis TaxID=79923 RepID=G7YLY8_CLOSI|nr:hypothetical protein CLF_111773 [Clonorchis sinensis]
MHIREKNHCADWMLGNLSHLLGFLKAPKDDRLSHIKHTVIRQCGAHQWMQLTLVDRKYGCRGHQIVRVNNEEINQRLWSKCLQLNTVPAQLKSGLTKSQLKTAESPHTTIIRSAIFEIKYVKGSTPDSLLTFTKVGTLGLSTNSAPLKRTHNVTGANHRKAVKYKNYMKLTKPSGTHATLNPVKPQLRTTTYKLLTSGFTAAAESSVTLSCLHNRAIVMPEPIRGFLDNPLNRLRISRLRLDLLNELQDQIRSDLSSCFQHPSGYRAFRCFHMRPSVRSVCRSIHCARMCIRLVCAYCTLNNPKSTKSLTEIATSGFNHHQQTHANDVLALSQSECSVLMLRFIFSCYIYSSETSTVKVLKMSHITITGSFPPFTCLCGKSSSGKSVNGHTEHVTKPARPMELGQCSKDIDCQTQKVFYVLGSQQPGAKRTPNCEAELLRLFALRRRQIRKVLSSAHSIFVSERPWSNTTVQALVTHNCINEVGEKTSSQDAEVDFEPQTIRLKVIVVVKIAHNRHLIDPDRRIAVERLAPYFHQLTLTPYRICLPRKTLRFVSRKRTVFELSQNSTRTYLCTQLRKYSGKDFSDGRRITFAKATNSHNLSTLIGSITIFDCMKVHKMLDTGTLIAVFPKNE